MRVFDCLSTPMLLSMLSDPFGGILCQPFDEIDMAPIKPRDRVVFDQCDSFECDPIQCDIEAVDTIPHGYNYQNYQILQGLRIGSDKRIGNSARISGAVLGSSAYR